jgi:Zn-dependent peptidase ImmA (M78 family)
MFAASVLMPRDVIVVLLTVKSARKSDFPDLYKLKDEFEVSISALTTRVQELNLLYIADKKSTRVKPKQWGSFQSSEKRNFFTKKCD